MARKSRYTTEPKVTKITNHLESFYRAGLYIRLSKEDGDKIESDSIVNQRNLLEGYAANQDDIVIYDYYIDDGYSGMNFNRPAFKRMISDVEAGNINCVIVKDLSRFGRELTETLKYIRTVFPEYKVRFISVSDSIDDTSNQYDPMMPIRSVFNEQYSADISRKVQASLRIKQQRGEFIGAFACYGYMKDPNDKGKLIVDPYAAQIVKRIFKLFSEGYGKNTIARLLNKEGIVCPSEYKRMNGSNYTNGNRLDITKFWTYTTIHRMLSNEMYIGNMVQRRSNRSNFRNKKNYTLPREEWAIVKNTHEPIVEKKIWDRVQILMKKDTRQLDFSGAHLFAGFVFCGDCERAMCKVNRVKTTPDYICGTYKRAGASVCSQHKINYSELYDIVLSDIKSLMYCFVEFQKKILDDKGQSTFDELLIKKQIDKIEAQISKIFNYKKSIYEDYKDEIITKEEFLNLKEDYNQQEQQLKLQKDSLSETLDSLGKNVAHSDWYQTFLRHAEINELTKDVLTDLIDKILIYEDKRIKIQYRFAQNVNYVMKVAKGEEEQGLTIA